MLAWRAGVFAVALAAASGAARTDEAALSVARGARWLASSQGPDGGWGQDGGSTSHVRRGENLETNGNDVANTAAAVLALVRTGSTPSAGEYRLQVRKGVEFVLAQVEKSLPAGLAVTTVQGTQIQRKLGPFIDTFLTARLLSEIDGHTGDTALDRRVRTGLEKVVRKIESAQLEDGSWNISGGWAPILGTSLASQGLFLAKSKGVTVRDTTMARADAYASRNAQVAVAGSARRGGGVAAAAPEASAGVALYDRAQTLEQLSRTEADRKKNAKAIQFIAEEVAKPEVMNGFGSMGGEEFFSYLNVSDSLKRAGGGAWTKWNGDIKAKLVRLQNNDGTWAGHHCITGRVAVTSAAILTMTVDRDSFPAVSKRQ